MNIRKYAEIAAYYIVWVLYEISYAAYWLFNRFIWQWYKVAHNYVEPALDRWRDRLNEKKLQGWQQMTQRT